MGSWWRGRLIDGRVVAIGRDMWSMTRLVFRFSMGAALVLVLGWPSTSIRSAAPVAVSLPLSGPFPTHQWVSLWVPTVDVTRDPGFF